MSAKKFDVLLKHSMSGAVDALVDYEIDSAAKRVTISMCAANSRKPFVTTGLLESFVFGWMPRQHEIEAYNDDDINSWHPKRTEWRITLRVGALQFDVRAWNQRPSGGVPQRTIELYLMEAAP